MLVAEGTQLVQEVCVSVTQFVMATAQMKANGIIEILHCCSQVLIGQCTVVSANS